jgi:hypothetical protein
MEKARLIEGVTTLNAAEYEVDGKKLPIITEKIKYVAVKLEKIEAAFKAACEGVAGKPQEEFVPQLVVDVYNELVEPAAASAEAEAAAAATTETTATEAAGTKAEEKKADTKADAKKKAPPARAKDAFGNAIGSMTGEIAAALVTGAKKEDIVKTLMTKFGRTQEKAEAYLKGCLKSWKERGFQITVKDEVYTMALPKK